MSGQALFQIVVLLVLDFGGNKILGLKGTHDEKEKLRTTIIFNAFVFCQVSLFRFPIFFTLVISMLLNHFD